MAVLLVSLQTMMRENSCVWMLTITLLSTFTSVHQQQQLPHQPHFFLPHLYAGDFNSYHNDSGTRTTKREVPECSSSNQQS